MKSELEARNWSMVRDFRDRVLNLGLWDEAWLGLVGIRSQDGWVCFGLRALLTGAGASVPTKADFFDAETSRVRVRGGAIELPKLWILLEDIARTGESTFLSEHFGEKLRLPTGKTEASLSFNNPASRNDREHLVLVRYVNSSFHELFGHTSFDALAPELRGHEPPYAGPKELFGNLLPIFSSNFDNNNAQPMFEVSAEIPVGAFRAFYNKAMRGIEVRFDAGLRVPLERLSVSLTPEPRKRILATDFRRSREHNGLAAFELLLPCSMPTKEVTASLQYLDVSLASLVIRPETKRQTDWLAVQPKEKWIETLEKQFHWTPARLRRQLRGAVPAIVAKVAEERIADSVRLIDDFPFFAVLSAASVAEVLLMERLARIKRGRREAAWADMRLRDRGLNSKLPRDLRFDQAIRLANELQLLNNIDSRAMDLLRIARNEVHIDRTSRPSREDFSPIRAANAILATLELSRGIQRRPSRRPKTPPQAP